MCEFLKLPSVSPFIIRWKYKTEPSQLYLSVNNFSLFSLKPLTYRKERWKSILKMNASYFAKFPFFISKRRPSFLGSSFVGSHGSQAWCSTSSKRKEKAVKNRKYQTMHSSLPGNLSTSPQHTYILHRKTRYIIFTVL